MRAVVQRVKNASVTVGQQVVGTIGQGLFILLGIGKDDTTRDVDWMVDKIINLRIFENDAGKFDRSLLDVDGELLAVSQFTLFGDCAKGRRPSFSYAMDAPAARDLFNLFTQKTAERVRRVATGVFQASMDVDLVNQGPVTLIIDSKR